jgi:TolB protein
MFKTAALCLVFFICVLSAAAQDTPDCPSQLAFAGRDRRGWNIYLLDADGSPLRRLTDDNNANQPAWSPDGSQIVYISGDGNSELFLLDVESRETRQLTDNYATDYFPAWSPDGSQIAFASGRDGELDIFVMDSDGENALNLTPAEGIGGDLPTWSPDSTQLAFYGDEGIMVVDADGANLRGLLPSEDDAFYYFPAWSPDGQALLVTRFDRTNGDEDLYLVDVDGENLRPLLVEDGEDFSAAWSPDGSQISYTSSRNGAYHIYTANADGSGERRLTENYRAITQSVHSEWRPCPSAAEDDV